MKNQKEVPKLEEIVFPDNREETERIFRDLNDKFVISVENNYIGYGVGTGTASCLYKETPLCKRVGLRIDSNALLLQNGGLVIVFSDDSPTNIQIIGRVCKDTSNKERYIQNRDPFSVRLYTIN